MLLQAVRLALAPVLYAQARRVRSIALELPEPEGPRRGEEGSGPVRLRVLVAGDSSAAGVGAATQDEALARPLARELALRLGGRIGWQLVAQTGLTSEGLLGYLRKAEVVQADVAVVVIGVNDLTREVPLKRALGWRAEVVAWSKRHVGVSSVLFASMPQMQRFPLIPQPLAWYAGVHARRNNVAQARWAASLPGVRHVDVAVPVTPQSMARDGYHPSPVLYAAVAARLAQAIAGAPAMEAAAPRGAAKMPRRGANPDPAPAADE